MTTSYTPSLRFWQGTPGDPAIRNVWGTALDTNFALVENAILSSVQVPVGGLTTYTLTTANGASDQARPWQQIFSGALTANCTVTYPNLPKFFQAINQTTGGFSIILTAGSGTTVTVPPENLPYNCQSDGNGNIVITQEQPGPRFGDWKFNSLPIEAGGWRLGHGQTRPRTDPLWQWLTAQGLTSSWPHGQGDGSTTYTMPDFRGTSPLTVDSQGGSAAGRVTSAGSGVNATVAGTVAGTQYLQSHSHGLSLSDPGHNHSHNDPGHNHGDYGHAHGVADPGHAHGVGDPGHAHTVDCAAPVNAYLSGGGPSPLVQVVGGTALGTYGSGTGIGIAASGTGIGIDTGYANIAASGTGVTNNAAGTGMGGSVAGAGAGGNQNMPPVMTGYNFVYVGA